MFNKDSVGGTILVAFVVCLVCAVFVASAAVVLKEPQERNQKLDRQRNILAAAGMLQEDTSAQSVQKQFENVETRIVDLRTGKFDESLDPDTFDQFKAAKSGDPELSSSFDQLGIDDSLKIGGRENYSVVYLVRDEDGIEKLILPIRGYGLWSTLYGFLALESNLNTVAGLGFYQHGETPGLGGEVDNPEWKAHWVGKQIYTPEAELAIEVIKGPVDSSKPDSQYKIDGLSGATLTTKGVSNLVRFWMGESGFGPFLQNLKNGEA